MYLQIVSIGRTMEKSYRKEAKVQLSYRKLYFQFFSVSFSQLLLETDWHCVILVNVIYPPLTRKVGTTTYALYTANLRCFADFKVD